MRVLENIFRKIIKTPLIGDEERETFLKCFLEFTTETKQLELCVQIETNYCTAEFLKTVWEEIDREK